MSDEIQLLSQEKQDEIREKAEARRVAAEINEYIGEEIHSHRFHVYPQALSEYHSTIAGRAATCIRSCLLACGESEAESILLSVAPIIKRETESLSPQAKLEFWHQLRAVAQTKINELNPPATRNCSPVSPPPSANQTDIEAAEELISEIIDKAESPDFPDAGADFAESVAGRARGIGETIEQTGEVTPGQMTALRNMSDGLDAWNRDWD